MSRHPTVEVISRIALDAAAPLDLTTGAIEAGSGRVRQSGQPEPTAANHSIRLTLFHPVASEPDG